MSKTSIKVSDLKKHYGKVKAVDGISFEVAQGTIFGMLGPNGAGKTTTIETLVGLTRRDGGVVNILDLDPASQPRQVKQLIGVQLQSPSLFPRLTIKEIINLFASFYPHSLPAEEVIERVGLTAKTGDQVRALSGGQRHRLAVGLAMVSNGEIIFLDEPTTGLDPQARRQLWDVIRHLKEQGVTVFLTTHYMEEAEQLCDQLVVIDQGRIIAQGSPRGLINQYFKEAAVEFRDPGFTEGEREQLKGLDLGNRMIDGEEEGKMILYTDDIPATIKRLLNFTTGINREIDDITVRHASLEDVFLKLTGRGIRE